MLATKVFQSKIFGQAGPYFPQGVDKLNAFWSKTSLCESLIFDLHKNHGISLLDWGREYPAGDYCWSYYLRFTLGNLGTVLVLFPQQTTKGLDRSIAFYTTGRRAHEGLPTVIDELRKYWRF